MMENLFTEGCMRAITDCSIIWEYLGILLLSVVLALIFVVIYASIYEHIRKQLNLDDEKIIFEKHPAIFTKAVLENKTKKNNKEGGEKS